MVSTGIPGIVLWISTFIYAFACCLQGVPLFNKYQMWSDLIDFLISQWEMVHSNINQQHNTHSCLFLHIFTGFVICDIHQWNGFDWLRQSWPWHWWMPSLHLEWYYATNNSSVHFYFCSAVEASSPLKVLSFFEFYWDLFMNYWTHWNLWCMWVFHEWQLDWYEELYNMGNKLLKCE